jgi:hypothetical protein
MLLENDVTLTSRRSSLLTLAFGSDRPMILQQIVGIETTSTRDF